jgi:hypothetical protein
MREGGWERRPGEKGGWKRVARREGKEREGDGGEGGRLGEDETDGAGEVEAE